MRGINGLRGDIQAKGDKRQGHLLQVGGICLVLRHGKRRVEKHWRDDRLLLILKAVVVDGLNNIGGDASQNNHPHGNKADGNNPLCT